MCNSNAYIEDISDCCESQCSSRVVEDAFQAFGDYCNAAPGATAPVTEALSSILTSVISSQVQAGVRPTSDLPRAIASPPAAATNANTQAVSTTGAPTDSHFSKIALRREPPSLRFIG